MSNDVRGFRSRRWEIIGFLLIAALMLWDLAVDYEEGAGWTHIAVELLILVTAAGAAFALWLNLKRTRSHLHLVQADAERWRNENHDLLQGFSDAIVRQFERWGLSDAETDIGFLLLKGLSHKEIARLRETSERTVREQSRSLYRKAGLSGRASLSAFFLEHIVEPESPRH